MTFNKERHPDPQQVQHYVSFKHFTDGKDGVRPSDVIGKILPAKDQKWKCFTVWASYLTNKFGENVVKKKEQQREIQVWRNGKAE